MMMRKNGRKVTRPGGIAGASNTGIKVNLSSSNILYPAFCYSLPLQLIRPDLSTGLGIAGGANSVGLRAYAGQERRKRVRHNSISYRSHSVKVVSQIVEGIQHSGERFL